METASDLKKNHAKKNRDCAGKNDAPSSSPSLYLGDILMEAKSKMQNKESKNGITVGLIGGSGRGKSTIIRKIFLEKLYNSKEYITQIFTESATSDALQNLSKDVIIDGVGVNQDALNYCYQTNQEYEKCYNFVVVLDDCIHLRHAKMIERMFLIMRNSNITSLMSLQHPKLIPSSIRSSIYFAICMGFNSCEDDEVAVRTWFGGYLPGNSIQEKVYHYQQWTQTSHRFFVLDHLNHRCYRVDEDYKCEELFLQKRDIPSSRKRKRKKSSCWSDSEEDEDCRWGGEEEE